MFKIIKHWWNKEVDNIFLISFGFMYHQVWIKFHILSFGFDFLFNIPKIFPIKEAITIVMEYDQKIIVGFFSINEFCK